MENWRNVKTTASGQEYIEARELSSGPRSSCRAIFFRNTHNTTDEKIISLKIARMKSSGGTLYQKKDKTITLSQKELDSLIEYIQEYYAPLNSGMTEYI